MWSLQLATGLSGAAASPGLLAFLRRSPVAGGRVARLLSSSRPLNSSPKRGGGGGGTARPSRSGRGAELARGSAAAEALPAGRGPSGASGGGRGGGSSASAASAHEANEVVATARDLGKTLPGGRVLFSGVGLSFRRGAKIGVLGLNGAGKSSLLKILAGVDGEHDGAVWRAPGLRVGYLAQEPALDDASSVHDAIMGGLREQTALLERFDALSAAMGEEGADLDALLGEQAEVQARIDAAGCWNLAHVAAQAKEALRVPPDGTRCGDLSGGEKRRVALCALLLSAPSLLLLDEPTNHLDATSVAWLERFLKDYRGTVLAVTHDRYFLDNVAGWILEIDRGSAFPYQGNYGVWLATKAARIEGERKSEKKRANALAAELAWMQQGAKARQAKGKARIARYEEMAQDAAEAKTRDRFLSGQMVIPPGPRLGDLVLEARGLTHAIGDRVLLRDVSFSLPKGAIVGIIGANGAGKTTLLRLLVGDFEPSGGGAVRVGPTVRMGLVSQSRVELEPNVRVLEAVCGREDTVSFGPDSEMPARQYLSLFNLVGEQQTKLVRSLSGGERNRVHLARTLRTGANLLMLDEPTNDLDIDTLRSLEEALGEWDGCAVVVSHDRYFLDRVCTHMLVFHGGGRVQWFAGSYSDYLQHIADLGKSAVTQGHYILPGSGAASTAMETAGGGHKTVPT